MCQKWREVRCNFVSLNSSRKILESAFVQSEKAKKYKVLVPTEHKTASGLVYKEAKSTLDYAAEKEVKKFLTEHFKGVLPAVRTCFELFPIQRALFSLKEFLQAIYTSYSDSFQQKYKIKYFDEVTGEEISTVCNVKMAINSWTRNSCGAGAPGGDTKITNFVLSCADYPLSSEV